MAKKPTANAHVDGVNYDASKKEDREALREMGFKVSDDGTWIEAPGARGAAGRTINVNNGNAKTVIQRGDIEGGITFD